MNYEEVFNDSYERALQLKIEGKTFFDIFYSKFISSSPVVKEKFKNTDINWQKQKVQKAFYHLLQFFVTKNTTIYMDKIARKHSKAERNIEPYLYDIFTECLISAVKEFDNKFDDDVELAWRMVLSSGVTFMKFKYDKYNS